MTPAPLIVLVEATLYIRAAGISGYVALSDLARTLVGEILDRVGLDGLQGRLEDAAQFSGAPAMKVPVLIKVAVPAEVDFARHVAARRVWRLLARYVGHQSEHGPSEWDLPPVWVSGVVIGRSWVSGDQS